MWQNENMERVLDQSFDLKHTKQSLQRKGWTIENVRLCYLAYCEWAQEDVCINDVLDACLNPYNTNGSLFHERLNAFFAGCHNAAAQRAFVEADGCREGLTNEPSEEIQHAYFKWAEEGIL